ncbi:hypothetical protein Nepgr_000013 [Nepenthes gracilis]|uniref:Uncharacterized protein n=1 Tax=Nepenthes gracilis TaxID=150966 RepID=A0AAD3RVY6_NEPGR|nr:hypothetical protein Nepgr_000013 [Nepenthes gracilis]
MAQVGESSSPPNDKPVIVRVKRKSCQSPLEAFWLEIRERPLKRPLVDFEKLSITGPSRKEGFKRRVFVQHVDTVSRTEATFDILQSFVQPVFDTRIKFGDRRHTFKENKQCQLLTKAMHEQEVFAKNARFEQIWRSRRGDKEAIRVEALDEVCRLYDVVRVDAEETSKKVKKQEEMSIEDQESLSKFLPLLRELIPSAAEDIESDISSYISSQEEYMYDLYAVNEDVNETDASQPLPLVQVNDEDDDEFYDGPDHSDYETDDSNAEYNPLNDYPEEESGDEEEECKTSGSVTDEPNIETGSEDADDTIGHDMSEDPPYVDEMDNSGYNDDVLDQDNGDGGDWRQALGH